MGGLSCVHIDWVQGLCWEVGKSSKLAWKYLGQLHKCPQRVFAEVWQLLQVGGWMAVVHGTEKINCSGIIKALQGQQ